MGAPHGDYKRLAGCSRWLVNKGGLVGVVHGVNPSTGVGRAYYQGLQHCGYSWLCPVCSATIADRRATDLQTIMDKARAAGEGAAMVTFTVSHRAGTPLINLLDALKDAMREVFSGTPFQAFRKDAGYIGAVKSIEVTYGTHGWHPHFHCIWLTSSPCTAKIRAFLDKRYRAVLQKRGLYGSLRRSVKVADASWSAAEYMAKAGHHRGWDVNNELTKGISKSGKAGLSPWDLLRKGLDSTTTPTHALHAKQLYLEYAEATRGAHQMHFSPGLRERYGVAVADDAAIVAGEADDLAMRVLALLTVEQWGIVLAYDRRAELLTVADAGDADILAAWLLGLGIVLVS